MLESPLNAINISLMNCRCAVNSHGIQKFALKIEKRGFILCAKFENKNYTLHLVL